MFGSLFRIIHQLPDSRRQWCIKSTFHRIRTDFSLLDSDKYLGRENCELIPDPQFIHCFWTEENIFQTKVRLYRRAACQIGQKAVSGKYIPLNDIKWPTVTIERFGIRIPVDRFFKTRKHILRWRLVGKPIQVIYYFRRVNRGNFFYIRCILQIINNKNKRPAGLP